jgi:hypothetical protein
VKQFAVPTGTSALALWFSEGVRAELTELEKKGGEQRYELHSGQCISPEGSERPIYRFTLADGTLVPEEATGLLQVDSRDFKATVVAQPVNRIEVQLDGADGLGPFVPRAILCVDDLGLLRRLAEELEEISGSASSGSPLAAKIFHPPSAGVNRLSLDAVPALNQIEGEQRRVIEQACASEITFVWGPPGTGKTHVIAHLIAALVAQGERVLMTSHTHAAVDQSIYETVKPAADTKDGKTGPLSNSDLERQGQIVRIGRVTNGDSKVPLSVQLDNIVAQRTEGIQSEINNLRHKAAPLTQQRSHLTADLNHWRQLNELHERLTKAVDQARAAAQIASQTAANQLQATERVEQCKERADRANDAWLFRSTRMQKAAEAIFSAERALMTASEVAAEADTTARNAEKRAESIRSETQRQANICDGLQPAESLTHQLTPIETELEQIAHRLGELQEQLDALARQVIADARVVAATLTKCYVGNDLDGQTFDALIVDEISMALPPLLFVAARRAFRRVILVGDFKQLPPIVRSDSELAAKRLRQDAFHLSGIARDLEPTKHPALTRLQTQHRMLPAIADAARAISYGPNLIDHPDVLTRLQPDWLSFLPKRALNVVDTADLHTWCGRQAGSLSRFNLYSAQIAVELAARAAAMIPRPDSTVPRPIGIVTPYAAQRRLLSRLIDALNLTDWVVVGTVHTFQGGQADLIIFDTVLDAPFWTARLCNPKELKDVRRDLNVALTRAKSKFVLVGSSDWLNQHAKPASRPLRNAR